MERKPVSVVLAFGSVFAPALAFAAVPGRAGDKTDAGPCDDLVAYVREALAGPVPDITRDRGPGYRDQEGNIEGRLSSTWHTQPRSYTVRVTPACRGSLGDRSGGRRGRERDGYARIV